MNPPMSDAPVSRLEEWSSLHPQLFWIYRGDVHPLGRRVTTEDPRLTAWLLLEGSVEVRSRTGRWRARAGEWMFPPSHVRSQHFAPGTRIVSLSFRVDWPGGRSLYDTIHGRVVAATRHPRLERAATALCRTVERRFPDASNHLFLESGTLDAHWEISRLFLDWLRAYADAMADLETPTWRPHAADERLGRALLAVEQHPLHRPFRERDLALVAGLSMPHLHRLFARHAGATPRTRYEERRLQTASLLLAQSDRPLKAIAADLAFSSPAHFSRWFHAKSGLAPRAYRRREQPGSV
jgi:AraC-like DNA-binding protein